MLAETQAAFAAALADPARPVPAGIVSPRGDADAKRFAVYRNNVFVTLTGALAKRFPVTQKLVGEEFFAGMARVFAGEEKPASPLMFEYGEGFPAFIEGFEPARGVPYLANVAQIEAAWTRAYHAADVEPLDLSNVAAIEPDRLAYATVSAHPSATLLDSIHPVGTIWAAHQTETVKPVAEWTSETILIVRPGMDVTVHVLPARDTPFARHLFAGASFGEAAEAASAADDQFDFGAALVGLVSLGAFCAISTEITP